MIYIYDIIMNFNNNYYEFYDWKSNDKFVHIKKIPLLFVSTSNLKKILNHEVKVNYDFLQKIKNKTRIHFQHDNFKYQYTCLISDGKKICGFIFNYKGKIILKSDLSVDEYTEILDLFDNYQFEDIKFKILKYNDINEFTTRNQLSKIKYIRNRIKNMSDDLLNYVFYEAIGKKSITKKEAYSYMIKNSYIDLIYNIIYGIEKIH